MANRRLLLSLKSYLGDAVMATPLVHALASAGYDLTVSTAPFVRPLLVHPTWRLTFLDPVTDRSPMAVLRYALGLREHRFDACVLVNRSFRSALVARIAGIRVRVGHVAEGRNGLLTHPVPFDNSRFEAFCSLDLARALDLDVADTRPALWLDPGERVRGDELRKGATVGLQPGARFPEKQLPSEALGLLARGLREAGHRVVLLGGKEEREDADRIAPLFGPDTVNRVAETSLRETLGVMAGLRLMIGADTGAMHLAVGVGCPTVTAFGPTPADKWGHDYAPHRVIRAPGGDMAALEPETLVRASLEALGEP